MSLYKLKWEHLKFHNVKQLQKQLMLKVNTSNNLEGKDNTDTYELNLNLTQIKDLNSLIKF
ncbi:Elongation factor G domain protein [Mycoplasmoides gallisepticum str. F]|nr:Elongation factor G domain protein [Mycoplasmoides gallisepticum str. F]